MANIDFNLARTGLPEQIADRIEASLGGENGGTGTLGSETALAKQFGVSRPVIREALLLLRGRGLITQKCGSSAQITLPAAPLLRDSVQRLVRLHGIGTSDVFSVRTALERESVRLAARNRSEEDLRLLCELNQELAACPVDDPKRPDLDIRFHTAVARAGGNRLFPIMIEAISSVLREIIVRALKNIGQADDAVSFHRQLIAAIEEGDADAAEKILIAHLTSSRANAGSD